MKKSNKKTRNIQNPDSYVESYTNGDDPKGYRGGSLPPASCMGGAKSRNFFCHAKLPKESENQNNCVLCGALRVHCGSKGLPEKTFMKRTSQKGMKATLPLDSISVDLRSFSAHICGKSNRRPEKACPENGAGFLNQL